MAPDPNRTVVVVDDAAANREYVRMVLEHAGCRVIEAADGEAGLAAVRRVRPDAVIVDMIMPVVDGFEMIRRLREDPDLGATRVILSTATFHDHEVARLAEALGVAAILPKPSEPTELIEIVDRVLGSAVAGAPPPAPGARLRREYDNLVVGKLAEKITELEEVRERLARILDAVGDGIYEVDTEGRTTFVNGAAATILGRARLDLIGADLHELAHGQDGSGAPCPADECPVRLSLDDGVARDSSGWTWRRADGTSFPVEFSVQPLVGSSTSGAVVSFRDVSDRSEAAEARIAVTVAEHANLAKSEFLSRMSHELRTPLNAIMGFSQLMELTPLDRSQAESVDHIRRAGAHLLELINEVLDITRIETGQLTVSVEPVDLAGVVDATVRMIRPAADARSLELVVRVPPDTWVAADQQRLRQCLLNLLSNAVKYNRPGGRVEMTAEKVAELVRITVRDTGPGIAQADLPRLFTPFERLGLESSEIEGTGLGLSLTRSLVEAMGGSVGVRSEREHGSSFWIDLEEAPPQVGGAVPTGDGHVPLDAPPTSRTWRVLYVEDNPANIRLLERILGLRPAVELLVAPQGSLALDLARDHDPDLVLLDLHLPDMSGEEVLARLRADPAATSLPIVVLSAEAGPEVIKRLRSRGATGYLAKPIDIGDVLRVVDDVVAGVPVETTAS